MAGSIGIPSAPAKRGDKHEASQFEVIVADDEDEEEDDLGNGVYVSTERGEKYLNDEIDTSEEALDEIESPINGVLGIDKTENQA